VCEGREEEGCCEDEADEGDRSVRVVWMDWMGGTGGLLLLVVVVCWWGCECECDVGGCMLDSSSSSLSVCS